jgi:hypothetical protein
MARINLSIPDATKAAMDVLGNVNWSEVARRAFDQVVNREPKGNAMISVARQIVSDEWGKAVELFELWPGSVTETVVARIIDRLDEEAAQETEIGKVYKVDHDGFIGTVIGTYITAEGKRGVVMQQDGTRVVHVYGKRFLGEPIVRTAI